jgi:raffinose/stachyose/melibiose transport system permease protein
MTRKKATNVAIEIILWFFSLLVFIPLYFIIINSLKSQGEVAGSLSVAFPNKLMFENYWVVLQDGKMLQAFLNSAIYSVFSAALCCILAALAAYIIVRRNNKLNRTIFNLFLIGMIAPVNMVTTYSVMKSLSLINTRYGLVLLYAASFLPFSILLYKGFVSNLPKSLDEAAIIDGAGPIRLFVTIIFPLLKPVTVTVAMLNFVNCWNDFMFPLYFTSDSTKWGVVLTLYQYLGQFFSSKQYLFSAATIIVIPTLIVYLLGQKYIISGMTAGAVKG